MTPPSSPWAARVRALLDEATPGPLGVTAQCECGRYDFVTLAVEVEKAPVWAGLYEAAHPDFRLAAKAHTLLSQSLELIEAQERVIEALYKARTANDAGYASGEALRESRALATLKRKLNG